MQPFFSSKGLIVLLVPLLLAGGCKKNEKDRMISPAPPVKVVVTVVDGNSAPAASDAQRTYSGTVAASRTSLVSFSVAGTINTLALEEGDAVSKGQLLGKVNSGDYENAANIAEAQLAEAQDAYNRLKKLHDAKALPDVKWVEMEQKLKEARNQAQITRRTLADATLLSPVKGTVSRKLASVGQNVVPGQPVYEIISASELTFNISVPESDIGNFAEGQEATVEFDNLDVGPLRGRVSQKAVVADPLTRAYTVKISLPDSDGKILPGMVGKVNVEALPVKAESDAGERIVLPPEAVQLDADNTNFVWIVSNGKARRQRVRVNEFVPDGVLVEAGLVKGDSVIVEGMSKVGTGTRVIPQTK